MSGDLVIVLAFAAGGTLGALLWEGSPRYTLRRWREAIERRNG